MIDVSMNKKTRPVYIFSGRIGSGKTTLSKAFAGELGLARAGFGDAVMAEASRRGLNVNEKAILQKLGQDLVTEEPEEFCRGIISALPGEGQEGGVIDGLRHIHIFETLTRILGAERLLLAFIAIDERERLRRLNTFRGWTPVLISQYDNDPTEIQVQSELPSLAHFTVDNSGSAERSLNELLGWASLH